MNNTQMDNYTETDNIQIQFTDNFKKLLLQFTNTWLHGVILNDVSNCCIGKINHIAHSNILIQFR